MPPEASCPSTNTIAELVCRQLDDAKAAEVEVHVADCVTCRLLVGTLAAASLPRMADGSGGDLAPAPEPRHDLAAHRYVVREELARGGMGRISIADDTLLGRRVAIKELLAPTASLAARFRRELALTSRLQHPAIVSIHDGGTWPSGEPFYVMRLVSGEPLDRVIARSASVAARIGLLPHGIAMVDALAYAHSQGVIHRDLKPANVLVGDFGETVVIDWGLAKDVRTPDEPPALETGDPARLETLAGLVLGTPAYMAPEQARGAAVDERADVYSLGAVLYHLLGGTAPYTGSSATEIVRAVGTGAPTPLAERAPGIPSDLLTLVGKAMARRPEDRYATAGELALDLKRFQRGQLVGAHRYSSWQLARRWIRKHRTAVAVGAIATVALATLGIVSVRRVVAEQQRADSNRADADELMTFMLTDLHDKLKPIGKLELLGTVAHKARDYYHDHANEQGPAELRNRVLAVGNLGEVLNGQGDNAGAIAELREALALAETAAARAPDDPDALALVSSCHSRLGSVLLDQLDVAAALTELRVALALSRQLATGHPEDSKRQQRLVFGLLDVGRALDGRGDTDEALADFREALATSARFDTPQAPAMWVNLLAESHGAIAAILEQRQDNVAALAENRAALAAAERLVRLDPKNGESETVAINYHLRIGLALAPQDPEAGLVEYRTALAAAEQLVARDPSNEVWQRAVFMSQSQVGDVLLAQGDTAHAVDAFRGAVASELAVAVKQPANAAVQHQLAVGIGHLGEASLAQGDLPAAAVEYGASLVITSRLAALDPTNVATARDLATSHQDLGVVLERQGANDLALAQYRAALATTQQIANRDPADADLDDELCVETISVGDALIATHDAQAAAALYRTAIALANRMLARRPSDETAPRALFDAHVKLGTALAGEGSVAEALAEYRAGTVAAEPLAARAPADPDLHAALADNHDRTGDLLRAHAEPAAALGEYRAGLAIAEQFAASDPTNAEWKAKVVALRKKLIAR